MPNVVFNIRTHRYMHPKKHILLLTKVFVLPSLTCQRNTTRSYSQRMVRRFRFLFRNSNQGKRGRFQSERLVSVEIYPWKYCVSFFRTVDDIFIKQTTCVFIFWNHVSNRSTCQGWFLLRRRRPSSATRSIGCSTKNLDHTVSHLSCRGWIGSGTGHLSQRSLGVGRTLFPTSCTYRCSQPSRAPRKRPFLLFSSIPRSGVPVSRFVFHAPRVGATVRRRLRRSPLPPSENGLHVGNEEADGIRVERCVVTRQPLGELQVLQFLRAVGCVQHPRELVQIPP